MNRITTKAIERALIDAGLSYPQNPLKIARCNAGGGYYYVHGGNSAQWASTMVETYRMSHLSIADWVWNVAYLSTGGNTSYESACTFADDVVGRYEKSVGK